MAVDEADEDDGSSGRYGGTLTDGGWIGSRVPAIDDVGGFFLPQLTQLEPGRPHPVLRQPVLRLVIPTAAITTSAQHRKEFRMVLETLLCNLDVTGRRSRIASRGRHVSRSQAVVDTMRPLFRARPPTLPAGRPHQIL
jgi:hypothetical protein